MLKKNLPASKVQVRKIRDCPAADVSFQIICQCLKAFFQTSQIETVLGFKIMVNDSLGNASVLADSIDRCGFRSVLSKFLDSAVQYFPSCNLVFFLPDS